MVKLFIIGNGFDVDHKMNTKYSHFRRFLINKYLISESTLDDIMCEIPRLVEISSNGDEQYNYKDVATVIIKMLDNTIGKNWNDVEKNLGRLDYGAFLDSWTILEDIEYEKCFKENYYRTEENARDLCRAFRLISDYFQDWVELIDEGSDTSISIKKDFKSLINSEKDFFLTFNYTRTLEKFYDVKNICHIHGKANEYIYFGHGNDKHDTNNIQQKWFGAENEINFLQDALRKNTEEAYNKNIRFFQLLSTIATNEKVDMYSYGFSFSDVDRFYLKKLFAMIDTSNSYFYLNDYDNQIKRNEYSVILKKCGFRGIVSKFSIKN